MDPGAIHASVCVILCECDSLFDIHRPSNT